MDKDIFKSIKVGEYVDFELRDQVTVKHKGQEIGKLSYGEEIPIKLKGRNLKGVMTDKGLKVLRFCDLHRHSGFSLLDGASKIEEIVEKTDYVGALTDHGNMFGFLKYYKAMKKAKKQPIIGMEGYMSPVYLNSKKNNMHIILLAKNEVGYKNLTKLTSLSYENGKHITFEDLINHKDGLIVTSACLGGEVARLIQENLIDYAEKLIVKFKEIFSDDYYLEIQRHNMEIEKTVNEVILRLADKHKIKVVATTDSHYTNLSDKEAHDILLCIQTKAQLSDENRFKFKGENYHIPSVEEMEALFKDIPFVLDNTLEIAEKCKDFKIDLNNRYMPKFTKPNGLSEDEYFEKLAWEGFNLKLPKKVNDPVYVDRLKMEIETIKNMGFSSYFLIVSDYVNYAKNNGIMVGPGRGSAVGSLVSYCLNITDLDPIPYGLFFERFLNPERITMPDIDMDFCFEKRDKVIDYVKKEYGDKNVSKIITFGTLGARSVIRDVTRVKGYEYGLGDKIAKMIPQVPNMTISLALSENPDLKHLYETDDRVRDIIDNSLKLEGLPRHSSIHACGLIIADKEVDNYLPEILLSKDGTKERASQVTMSEVEELGLLKMDFLGLRTMTVIEKTINSIKKNEGIDIDPNKIPHNDPYVYLDIQKGKTFGVFQLESSGMRSFMKELYSDVPQKIKYIQRKYKGNDVKLAEKKEQLGQELFERLIAGISLYRPGPMDYIKDYLEGMKDPKNIKYEDERLKPILKNTYGVIVYQEQVMQIVQELGGYTLGRADIVRRAMGKKKTEVMEAERNVFIYGEDDEEGNIVVKGCVRNGVKEEVAKRIWDKMSEFSKYAFNKSHSAGYALISIRTAWLKYYYPVDFMAETINSFINNQKKLKVYLNATKDMGISIQPPNVNLSNESFSRDDKNIIFGLKSIKNVGQLAEHIIEERRKNGKYSSLRNFVERLIDKGLNKQSLENLIYAGALDDFSGSRKEKIENLSKILEGQRQTKQISNQISIFDLTNTSSSAYEIQLKGLDEYDKRVKLSLEKQCAGLYISQHPLDDYKQVFKNTVSPISDFILSFDTDSGLIDDDLSIEESENISPTPQNLNIDGVYLAGIVEDLKIFYSKKTQKPIYSFTLEDQSGEIKTVMFSSQVEKYGHLIAEGNIILAQGDISIDDMGTQFILKNCLDIDSFLENNKGKNVKIIASDKLDVQELKSIIKKHNMSGKDSLYIQLNNKTLRYENPVDIKYIPFFLDLINRFGQDKIFVS